LKLREQFWSLKYFTGETRGTWKTDAAAEDDKGSVTIDSPVEVSKVAADNKLSKGKDLNGDETSRDGDASHSHLSSSLPANSGREEVTNEKRGSTISLDHTPVASSKEKTKREEWEAAMEKRYREVLVKCGGDPLGE
jgi:hypothetical protein